MSACSPCSLRTRFPAPQLGLQSRETAFNSLNGPDGAIPLNEDFTFSWWAADCAAAAVDHNAAR